MTADFAAALHEYGLRPRAVSTTPGRWHRTGTANKPRSTNGRYRLDYDRKGRLFATILDMARPGESCVWRPEAPLVIQAPDFARIRRQQQEDRRRKLKATERAREFYARCSPLIGGHEYLSAKGLGMAGCRGLKVDAKGWLVVPMAKDGKLISLQRIAPDGKKLFWKDAPSSAVRYVIDRQGATLTVLCEGLATGLAIYAATPLARVIVTFTANNLPKVAAQLPRRGMAVVAADNDHQTAAKIGRNPGLDAAHEAAALLGCGVAVPEGITGSDWCDARQQWTAEALERPVYGRRAPTEGRVRQTVDARIAREMMRGAKLLMEAE